MLYNTSAFFREERGRLYVENENDFPRVFEKIKYLSENEEAYEEMRKKDIITKKILDIHQRKRANLRHLAPEL